MAIRKELDAVVAKWNLLDHPFYQAWNKGTLPVEALKTYAREYGCFIRTISDGWAAHGDKEIAAEEAEHAIMWEAFAADLGAVVSDCEVPEAQELHSIATEAFSSEATSIGGLFAFEAQQPYTSQSKLKGLQDHYNVVGEKGQEYFKIHCDDFQEMEILADRLKALPEDQQQAGLAACERVAEALWNALSGIYTLHPPVEA